MKDRKCNNNDGGECGESDCCCLKVLFLRLIQLQTSQAWSFCFVSFLQKKLCFEALLLQRLTPQMILCFPVQRVWLLWLFADCFLCLLHSLILAFCCLLLWRLCLLCLLRQHLYLFQLNLDDDSGGGGGCGRDCRSCESGSDSSRYSEQHPASLRLCCFLFPEFPLSLGIIGDFVTAVLQLL